MEKRVLFKVEGMNCSSCVNKIKEGLTPLIPEVSLEDKTVKLSFDSELGSLKEYKETIEDLGFSVTSMTNLND